MKFSEILSQKKAIWHLQNMLRTRRIPPALLFTGVAGCGKFPAALAFAAALNCSHKAYVEKKQKPLVLSDGDLFAALPKKEIKEPEKPEKEIIIDTSTDESCGQCLSCLQLKNGVHPDIVITGIQDQAEKTGKDSANLKIDAMRDMLKKVYQRAFISPYKVFIVRDAEKLVPEAQNSLLKTLEAPPEGTFIILISSDKNSLLPTILSRVTEVKFSPLSLESMQILLKKEGYDEKEAALFAKFGAGSLDKARSVKLFKERISSAMGKNAAFRVVASLPKESHKAREEVNAMLELMLWREREIWKNSPQKQNLYASIIKDTLEWRSMTNRNVSTARILQAALLAGDAAGLTIEQLFGE